MLYFNGQKSHLCNLFCKDYWACQDERGGEVYKELSMRREYEGGTIKQEDIRMIITEGAGVYNDPYSGWRVFENWKDSKEGRFSLVAKLFYESLARRNQRSSTFVWSINDNLEKEIFNEISNHTMLQ